MRAGLALVLVVVTACFAIVAEPALANEPSGKEDSPVSPLLQQFIEQRKNPSAKIPSPSEGSAVVRLLSDSEVVSEYAHAADETASEQDSSGDPVRFDSSARCRSTSTSRTPRTRPCGRFVTWAPR